MSSDSSPEYAIEVTGLSKCYEIYDKPRDRLTQMLVRGRKQYYKEFWALKDVSFKIKKGETIGIIGRNGSGKSTLLQMICGTLNPTTGDVKVNGRVAALLELGAGFNPEFSGVENVYMAASLYSLSKEEVDQRFDAIATFADIGDHIHQPVKTYSSGMYVRLAFAVIAHVNADILVIDEALAVGDVFFTQKCMRFLKQFQERGTVLLVTHDMSSVLALCDGGVWLDKGQLKEWGVAKTICESYLSHYYDLNRDSTIGKPTAEQTTYKDKLNSEDFYDCRQNLINTSSLRNDLEVSIFKDQDDSTSQTGRVSVVDVYFQDIHGQPVKWFIGGELVTLKVVFRNEIDIQQPIIGFIIKDKLGQSLFGDNTYLTFAEERIALQKNTYSTASFTFRMPIMPAGEYTVGIAIASGTQQDHVMHTWVHDSLVISSNSKSMATGLLGIPMLSIEIDRYEG
ncbi:MAG: ABC transporter ATP-binding protein [Hydrogenophaga sp.]|uniref:ABC transporter ATP-binding protein n=1 Tax=Hydrogenophaga sp. TaxID=1904254 RepID=UPI001BBCEB2A|nr:ABC transporter ATP-binding protein [Hydrogenophaga sp.]MBS3910300.1 ABC transporter ATP-binding protein [Hydrogenophaga sp.]MDO9605231.1 ABC transporter ATP-binding protein [Hydrogenophaga sp.]MDP2163546.1 ABC transporter ATP-binding protein [Hydrogenophaga sp.]MDP3474833.1 ABC transporter ATP-binding protein [Hydrogenophaga sp.]